MHAHTVTQLLNLFLPTPCISCQKPGSPFCSACQAKLEINPRAIQKGDITGFAFCDYGLLSGAIVNAIKETGQTSLIGPLASLMAKQWPEGFADSTLVPIPSSPANYKRRGYQHTLRLANALEKRIPGSKSASLLRSSSDRLDQSKLGLAERLGNLEGAFEVDLRGFVNQGRPIVLIDDVVTTGATISAASSALAESGLSPVSFCVFAQTRAKSA